MAETRVIVETNFGSFTVDLDAARAPGTVQNFLGYVDRGHYAGTVFHRVIPTFMIQGGGYDEKLEKRATGAPIRNEAENGVKNERGTVAMARTGDPHSATAQFFVNVTDNPFLDFTSQEGGGWGYAVFGRVVDGMDVVDRIRDQPTGPSGPFTKDVPLSPVIIRGVRRAEG